MQCNDNDCDGIGLFRCLWAVEERGVLRSSMLRKRSVYARVGYVM
jgi:hypothetical protein